jgi:murein L,D-transpeptidase YcbB/YkuD
MSIVKASIMPAVMLLFLLNLPVQIANADNGPFKEQLIALLGQEDTRALVGLSGKTIFATRIIRQMYQARQFEPLWSDSAIKTLSHALNGLELDGLSPADYRFAEIESQLRVPNRSSLTPEQSVKLDILLSEAFLRALYNRYYGKADPEQIDPDINFTRTYAGKDPALIFLQHITRNTIAKAFERARPQNQRYRWLKDGLARYRAYQDTGGWGVIPAGDTLKPGDTHLRVIQLRERLTVTGDLAAGDTLSHEPEFFDNALKAGVERFQARHGLEVDGVVGAATLAMLNVPVQERIDQIRVNLERARWILHEAYDEYLVVDIAGFHIYWAKDDKIQWQEQIQVGKQFTKTPVFKGEIRYLDFNPTWTIPPGILKRSVIPGLIKDPGYLDKKGYQLLTKQGKPADPKSVDWKNLKGFPYIVRQPAGPDNALGLVKFLFPNPHFVFLHDTNHRELFDRTKRTFSSGCIRVRNPLDLAERLLAGHDDWTRERIDKVIASGKTTRVLLKQPKRILIAYNTARVPAGAKQVHFRPDIYQRDAKVLAALDGPFRLRQRDVDNI